MIPEIDEGEAVELTDVSKPEGVSLHSSLVPIAGYFKTPIVIFILSTLVRVLGISGLSLWSCFVL